jgi:hypothetical protein
MYCISLVIYLHVFVMAIAAAIMPILWVPDNKWAEDQRRYARELRRRTQERKERIGKGRS